MTPIFIFSLPRSGSTLLQSLAAAHQDITTTAEPWILLPLLSARKRGHSAALHDHGVMVDALDDFCATLPNGNTDYDIAVRQFVLGLYQKQGDTKYFLDKTPRYSLIAAEILRVFPDAKIIFLWRNPLAILASMLETWGQGRWNIFRYYADIYAGLDNLINLRQRLGAACIDLKFEDLLHDPDGQIRLIGDYLGLEFDKAGKDAPAKIDGRLGDPLRGIKYDGLSKNPIDSWRKLPMNALRRRWMRGYLRWLGPVRLGVMGYDPAVLLADLKQSPVSLRYLASDAFLMAYGVVFRWLNLPSLRQKTTARMPVAVQR